MKRHDFKINEEALRQADALQPSLRDRALSFLLREHCGHLTSGEAEEVKRDAGLGVAIAMLGAMNLGANTSNSSSLDHRKDLRKKRKDKRSELAVFKKDLEAIESRDDLFGVPPFEAAVRVLGIRDTNSAAIERCRKLLGELGNAAFREHLETVWTKLREGQNVKNPVGLFFHLCDATLGKTDTTSPPANSAP